MYSYINGYREGVIFLFQNPKDETILLEIRNPENNTDIFFTNGSIEEKDTHSNYQLNTLLREIREEFDNKISVHKQDCNYIDMLYVDDIKLVFYIYLIQNWEGSFPEFTIEENNPFAKLIWVTLEEAKNIISYESGREILDIISKYI